MPKGSTTKGITKEPKKTKIPKKASKEPNPKEVEHREVEPKDLQPTSLDETRASLLGGNDVLGVQPLSVENSLIKAVEQRPSGERIFFGKMPKVCSNKAFKLPDIRIVLLRPIYSEPLKFKKQSSYNTQYEGAIKKRWSDRLKTLQAKNIPGPRRKHDDPYVIAEDDRKGLTQ